MRVSDVLCFYQGTLHSQPPFASQRNRVPGPSIEDLQRSLQHLDMSITYPSLPITPQKASPTPFQPGGVTISTEPPFLDPPNHRPMEKISKPKPTPIEVRTRPTISTALRHKTELTVFGKLASKVGNITNISINIAHVFCMEIFPIVISSYLFVGPGYMGRVSAHEYRWRIPHRASFL